MVQISPYENIQNETGIGGIIAELEFESLSGESPVFPQLVLKFRGRARVQSAAEEPFEIRPMSIECTVTLGMDPAPNLVIAKGLGERPLRSWIQESSAQLIVKCPLMPGALRVIEDHLVNDIVPMSVEVSGTAEIRVQDKSTPFQILPARIDVRRSAQEWITNVLRPIEHGSRLTIHVKLPKGEYREKFESSFVELSEASQSLLTGHDAGVSMHVYKALEAIGLTRREIAAGVAPDSKQKQRAVLDLLKSVRSFANGGRHAPNDSRAGAFAVDHIDAEYTNAIGTATVAYLSKRLSSGD